MPDSDPKQRFARYNAILTTVFGAAFGVVGTLETKMASTVCSIVAAIAHFLVAALAALWIIARSERIAAVVMDHKPVRAHNWVILVVGVILSAAAVIGISMGLKYWLGIETAGMQLAAVLSAWAIATIFVAFWARHFSNPTVGG